MAVTHRKGDQSCSKHDGDAGDVEHALSRRTAHIEDVLGALPRRAESILLEAPPATKSAEALGRVSEYR
jgi:hypothetical protein